MKRVSARCYEKPLLAVRGSREALDRTLEHTLCFSRSSLLRGALMITRRTLDGAPKCALRDFLREEWRAGSHQVSRRHSNKSMEEAYRYLSSSWRRCVDVVAGCRRGWERWAGRLCAPRHYKISEFSFSEVFPQMALRTFASPILSRVQTTNLL